MGRKRKNVTEKASDELKKLHSKKKPAKTLVSLSKVTEVSVPVTWPKKEHLVENPDAVENQEKPKEHNLEQQLTDQSEEVNKNIDNHVEENKNGSTGNQQQIGEQSKEPHTMENNSHVNKSSNQSIDNQPKLGEQTGEQHTIVNNSHINNKKMGELGGVIFLCNGKTKSDCFRYMVLGFPDSRKDLVMSIKPDLRLFLYDYHLKVLHGIYKAASPGGMRLEPAAFNGGFPAQVRFEVDQDCPPMPFSTLCGFLQNFDARTNMIQPELSVEQVEKLMNAFLQTRLNSRPMNVQPGANPTMAPRPLVPGQIWPHPQPGALFDQANSQYAAGLVRTYGSPLPQGNPFASGLVRAYGSMLPPRGNPPVPPQIPFDNHFPPNAMDHQTHPLQPHFSAPANPVPAQNPIMGGADSRHIAHPNSQLAPHLQPQFRPPILPSPFMAPREPSRPRLLAPADPATMPISHKYALDLNPDAGRLSSQRCDQANSLSADTSQMANRFPFSNDSKSSEKIHAHESQPLQPSLATSTRSHLSHDLATLSESIDLSLRKVPHSIEPERADFLFRHGDQVDDRQSSLFYRNGRQQQQRDKTDVDSLPVSSRYAFDGPSLKYR